MKKLLSLLLVFCLLCATASAASFPVTGKDLQEAADRKKLAEADQVIAQLKESIGEELWESAKADGISVQFSFMKGDDYLLLTTSLNHPNYKAEYHEVLYPLFYAIIDSPVFDLTDDERAVLKDHGIKNINDADENSRTLKEEGRYFIAADSYGYDGAINMIYLECSPYTNDLASGSSKVQWQAAYIYDELDTYRIIR